MSTDTNVVVATDAAPQLKSTDTMYKAPEVPKAEPVKEKPEPAPKAVEADPVEGVKDDAPDADSPKGTEKRMPRWMKERLERERQVTEARTREAMLREFQDKQPKVDVAPVVEEPKRKSLEDFNFDQDAYTDYLVDHKLKTREEKQRLESENKKRAEAAETFKSKVDAFEERAGDGTWQDIVESPLNTDPGFKPLTDLISGDDHDLDIFHHLATNLDEAKRIQSLPKLQQIREIAKLAEKFDSDSQADVTAPSKPAPLPKKTTAAPPPPKTVSGSGKVSVDIQDPHLSTEQRIAAWRNARRR